MLIKAFYQLFQGLNNPSWQQHFIHSSAHFSLPVRQLNTLPLGGFITIIHHQQLCKHPEFGLVLCQVFGSPRDQVSPSHLRS